MTQEDYTVTHQAGGETPIDQRSQVLAMETKNRIGLDGRPIFAILRVILLVCAGIVAFLPGSAFAHGRHIISPVVPAIRVIVGHAWNIHRTATVPAEALVSPEARRNTEVTDHHPFFTGGEVATIHRGTLSQLNVLETVEQFRRLHFGPDVDIRIIWPPANPPFIEFGAVSHPWHYNTVEDAILAAKAVAQSHPHVNPPFFMTFHLLHLPEQEPPRIEFVDWTINGPTGTQVPRGTSPNFDILPLALRCQGNVWDADAPVREGGEGIFQSATLRWRVFRGTKPVGGLPVKIKVFGPQSGSPEAGGHNHNGLRSIGALEAIPDENGIITLTSNEDGFVTVKYVPSVVSGLETIRASVSEASNTSEAPVVKTQVKVPHLSPLAFNIVRLTPAGEPGNHPDRFNGRNLTLTRIRNASLAYEFFQLISIPLRALTKNIPEPIRVNGWQPEPIRVNDMSLPWGGLFDIRSDWLPPHSGHRCGTVSDIQSKHLVWTDGRMPVVGEGIPCNDVGDKRCAIHKHQWRLLGTALTFAGATPCFHDNHLHVFWDRPGTTACFAGSFNPFP